MARVPPCILPQSDQSGVNRKRIRAVAGFCGLLHSVRAKKQEETSMDPVERARRDVVIANRILAQQRVLDAYGHVSIRHPLDPNKYLLARSLSPGIVDIDDIVEFHLDGTPDRAGEAAALSRAFHSWRGVREARRREGGAAFARRRPAAVLDLEDDAAASRSFTHAATWGRTFPCGTSRASSAARRACWCSTWITAAIWPRRSRAIAWR